MRRVQNYRYGKIKLLFFEALSMINCLKFKINTNISHMWKTDLAFNLYFKLKSTLISFLSIINRLHILFSLFCLHTKNLSTMANSINRFKMPDVGESYMTSSLSPESKCISHSLVLSAVLGLPGIHLNHYVFVCKKTIIRL